MCSPALSSTASWRIGSCSAAGTTQAEPLPIISPHGHCDPRWWADDEPFADPATLLITGDHYVLRMLHSAGVPLDALGRVPLDGGPVAEPRSVWRTFAAHYDLFHATPSRLWLDHALSVVLGVDVVPDADNADRLFDELSERLAEPAFRPRALFDRFGIEFLRMRESLFGPFAVAHVFSLAAICVGVALLYSSYRSPLVSHA